MNETYLHKYRSPFNTKIQIIMVFDIRYQHQNKLFCVLLNIYPYNFVAKLISFILDRNVDAKGNKV